MNRWEEIFKEISSMADDNVFRHYFNAAIGNAFGGEISENKLATVRKILWNKLKFYKGDEQKFIESMESFQLKRNHSSMDSNSKRAHKESTSLKLFLGNIRIGISINNVESIFDYGCANGFIASLLSKKMRCNRVVGYEPYPMSDQLIPIINSKRILDSHNDKYELVICSNVLHHVPNYMEAIDKLCDLSYKYILIKEHNIIKERDASKIAGLNFLHWLYERYKENRREYHYNYFSKQLLENEFIQRGFVPIKYMEIDTGSIVDGELIEGGWQNRYYQLFMKK